MWGLEAYAPAVPDLGAGAMAAAAAAAADSYVPAGIKKMAADNKQL